MVGYLILRLMVKLTKRYKCIGFIKECMYSFLRIKEKIQKKRMKTVFNTSDNVRLEVHLCARRPFYLSLDWLNVQASACVYRHGYYYILPVYSLFSKGENWICVYALIEIKDRLYISVRVCEEDA